MRSPLLTVFLFGLAVAASACGGSETTAASGGATSGFESPIGEFLGVDFDFNDDEQVRINEQISACMTAEGFEWVAPDQGLIMAFTEEAGPDGLVWGSDEWVAKYGFGISTMSFSQESVGENLVGSDFDMFDGAGGDDPNQEYVESLTEAEQAAYQDALYGNDQGPEIDQDMTEEEFQAAFEEWEATREITGCEPKAYESAFGADDLDAFELEFGAELDALFEDLENHPRIVEAEQETASCVADKGLEYTDMDAVYDTFQTRLEPLWQDMSFGDFPADVTEEDMASMDPAEMEALFVEPELSDEAKTTLGEIQADEVALAVAVNDCGGGSFGPFEEGDVYEEVRIEVEQQFLDENSDRLDAFKADQSS